MISRKSGHFLSSSTILTDVTETEDSHDFRTPWLSQMYTHPLVRNSPCRPVGPCLNPSFPHALVCPPSLPTDKWWLWQTPFPKQDSLFKLGFTETQLKARPSSIIVLICPVCDLNQGLNHHHHHFSSSITNLPLKALLLPGTTNPKALMLRM